MSRVINLERRCCVCRVFLFPAVLIALSACDDGASSDLDVTDAGVIGLTDNSTTSTDETADSGATGTDDVTTTTDDELTGPDTGGSDAGTDAGTDADASNDADDETTGGDEPPLYPACRTDDDCLAVADDSRCLKNLCEKTCGGLGESCCTAGTCDEGTCLANVCKAPTCPADMVLIPRLPAPICIDKWETSYNDATMVSMGTWLDSFRNGQVSSIGCSSEDIYVARFGNGPVAVKRPRDEIASPSLRQCYDAPTTGARQGAVASFESYSAAWAACAIQGKRLCQYVEWQEACHGAANTRFGYGNEYEPDRCFLGWEDGDRAGVPEEFGDVDPYFTPFVTGSYPECVNDIGVYDMIGGVHEWVLQNHTGLYPFETSEAMQSWTVSWWMGGHSRKVAYSKGSESAPPASCDWYGRADDAIDLPGSAGVRCCLDLRVQASDLGWWVLP